MTAGLYSVLNRAGGVLVGLENHKETPDGLLITIYTKPSSDKFAIEIADHRIMIYTKSAARDNKANIEMLKELKKLLKRSVRLVSGATFKEKILLIEDCDIKRFKKVCSG